MGMYGDRAFNLTSCSVTVFCLSFITCLGYCNIIDSKQIEGMEFKRCGLINGSFVRNANLCYISCG